MKCPICNKKCLGKFGINNPYDKSKESVVTTWLCIEGLDHYYEHRLNVEALHKQCEIFKLDIHSRIFALRIDNGRDTEYYDGSAELISLLKSDKRDNLWVVYQTLSRLTQAQCLK